MSDRLTEIIEDLQADPNLDTLSEAEISQSVCRVFNALGWDADNHREVKPEYIVANRRVDYALLIVDTPQVFVEVKKGGDLLERHQEYLLDHAFQAGIRLAVLTNGAIWWFYMPLQSGSWEQRKFASVCLDTQDKGEVVQVLVDILDRENIENGKAFQSASSLHGSKRLSVRSV